jgi:hypothetical protein
MPESCIGRQDLGIERGTPFSELKRLQSHISESIYLSIYLIIIDMQSRLRRIDEPWFLVHQPPFDNRRLFMDGKFYRSGAFIERLLARKDRCTFVSCKGRKRIWALRCLLWAKVMHTIPSKSLNCSVPLCLCVLFRNSRPNYRKPTT